MSQPQSGYPHAPGDVEIRHVSPTCRDVFVRGEYQGCVTMRTPQQADVHAHALADYARCAAAAGWVANHTPMPELAHELGGEG